MNESIRYNIDFGNIGKSREAYSDEDFYKNISHYGIIPWRSFTWVLIDYGKGITTGNPCTTTPGDNSVALYKRFRAT